NRADAIDADQQILNDPDVPARVKGPIRQDIRRLQGEVDSLRRELQQCRTRLNSNLAIIGVERTQATQYFFINGQGSGFAGDNSVGLVARKAMVLRVYVNSTTFPQFPIPTFVSGRVVYPGLAELSPINRPIFANLGSTLNRGSVNDTLNFW